jgi:hypothetical protein
MLVDKLELADSKRSYVANLKRIIVILRAMHLIFITFTKESYFSGFYASKNCSMLTVRINIGAGGHTRTRFLFVYTLCCYA